MAAVNEDTSALTQGFAAMAGGAWEEARSCFKASLEQEVSAEAYEGLSWAAWSLNEAEELFEAREAAFRLYRQAQDNIGAARMAMWLGSDYVDFRGDLSITNGWCQLDEAGHVSEERRHYDVAAMLTQFGILQ